MLHNMQKLQRVVNATTVPLFALQHLANLVELYFSWLTT